jgi:hypothetical protein
MLIISAANANRWASERRKMRKPKLRIELVKFCSISGDPGCLGYPEWHDEECDYVDVECLFCKCGSHNVYGEMAHNEGCYYFANPDEAQPVRAVDRLRSWLRNFEFPKFIMRQDDGVPF